MAKFCVLRLKMYPPEAPREASNRKLLSGLALPDVSSGPDALVEISVIPVAVTLVAKFETSFSDAPHMAMISYSLDHT